MSESISADTDSETVDMGSCDSASAVALVGTVNDIYERGLSGAKVTFVLPGALERIETTSAQGGEFRLDCLSPGARGELWIDMPGDWHLSSISLMRLPDQGELKLRTYVVERLLADLIYKQVKLLAGVTNGPASIDQTGTAIAAVFESGVKFDLTPAPLVGPVYRGKSPNDISMENGSTYATSEFAGLAGFFGLDPLVEHTLVGTGGADRCWPMNDPEREGYSFRAPQGAIVTLLFECGS